MHGPRLIGVAVLAAATSLLLVASSAGFTENEAAENTLAAVAPMPPAADMIRLREAMAAADSGDWAAVRGAQQNADDALVKRMLEWRYASAQSAPLEFQPIAQALTDLPGWPARTTMRQRAEQAIFDSALSPERRIEFLRSENGPVSGDGRIALANALRATGERAQAVEIARRAWREDILTATARAEALADFGGAITTEDHADRVAMLLWRGERTEARGLFTRIGAADRAVATARIALQSRQRRGLQRAVDAVPSSRRDDPGLLYDRARYVRRAGRPEDAMAMAIAQRIVPSEAPAMARDDIFEERRLYVARALRNHAYRTAYALVSNHGMSSGESFADAEWLSGWISLRFLQDPAQATAHFQHLAANVSAPVSRARALYWQAEAARAQGDATGADAMLQQAAQFPFTYYGQLAAVRSTSGQAMLSLPATSTIGADARARFEQRELVRALRVMSEVGDQGDFESIAFYLDDTLQDPQEIELLSQMARDRSYNRTALRSAKAGLFRGVVATNAAYPLLELPPAAQTQGPEPALVLSIIRQESEFDVGAVSHANAHGLMQLIPGTARLQARAEGMEYNRSALTTDPNYNITLGATHLKSLVDEFNGSYVLAIASYNAGSYRAREWIDDWGDPRSASVDVVDWVELIPFAETRNYVQRVMENLQVYRYRLAGQAVPITLDRDLKRGG